MRDLITLILSLAKFFYYLFWPLIKLFELTLPFWIFVWKIARYLNPFLWWCALVHGVEWRIVGYMMPYGIGGGYDREGYYCQECDKLYCGRDSEK